MQRLCFSLLYQIAYIISRSFHCDAIIPIVKLFWCVALEPMAGSKCKPGQGQWALKLESRCYVIKTLFSTAMAGQDNVSAQKAFLEENGCNAGRCYACDVMILSQTDELALCLNTSAREVLGSIFGPVQAVSSVVMRTGYRCGRSRVRLPGWSNRHSVANGLLPLRRFCVTQALRDGPQ